MLTDDTPAWPAWDGVAYSHTLGYDSRPAADALTLVLAIRNVNIRLLASMPVDQWRRTAIHPTAGVLDVAGWVGVANDHLAEHVLQARRAVIGMT
jgi:hypothetical protein